MGRELVERTEGIRPKHAKAKAVVRLPDGRTGRVIWVAPYGRSAKVRLPSGAVIQSHADVLELTGES